MHITILSIGSRGDVQPYIALGMGLRQAGVQLLTHAPFESMIRHHGLDFAPITIDMQTIHQSQEGRALFASGSNPWRFVQGMPHQLKQQVVQIVKDCWRRFKTRIRLVYNFTGHDTEGR